MERWRLLAVLSAMLVVWAVIIVVTGAETTPIDVVLTIVFALVGIYVGRYATERFFSPDDE